MTYRHFAALTAVLFAYISAEPPPSLEGWNNVFEDEFEGSSLDTTKWNPTYNWGHTHNHRAYCVAENVLVEDGLLRIKGEDSRDPDAPETTTSGGKTYSLDYTSGAMDTRGKFSIKYGYIEGRFKAPSQLGTWPAFWMLQDGWPPEIDILEIPKERTIHHYYMHYTDPDWYADHGAAWDHEASFGGTHTGADKSAGFHNYGVEWDASSMNFYFDDKRIASYSRPTEISQASAMYIIVNLAIGGWAGDDIEVTENNPAYFEAEWVRVWKKKASLPDSVRILSVAQGKCMIPSENTLVLGDCTDSTAYATLQRMSGTTYRINFGEKVLEIPNESTEAGAALGIWGWNGKDHQKTVLEPQSGFSGTVVRIKMVNSGLYLRNSGDQVIQDWSDSWVWNQNWRIVTNDSELPESTKLAVKKHLQEPSLARLEGNALRVVPGNRFREGTVFIRVFNLKGRLVASAQTRDEARFNVDNWTPGLYQIVFGRGGNTEYLLFMYKQ